MTLATSGLIDSKRPVWYQLMDERRNKLGSAGRVEVAKGDEALIVEFLGKVKEQNEGGRMKGIGVVDVVVYPSSVETTPMSEDKEIGSCGKTKQTALIVVLPPPPQEPPDRSKRLTVGSVSFSVRDNMVVNPAYWSAQVATTTADTTTPLTEQASILAYGNVMDLPPKTYILGQEISGSRVFVRECYPPLWKVCMGELQMEPRLVVLGNPGIGKTYFGYVILRMLAQQGETVVYQCRQGERILFSPDVVVRGSGTDFDEFLRKRATYYLVDGLRPDSYDCKTILLTSPRREAWYEFYKTACSMVFMPVWSEEEIFKCHALMLYPDVSVDKVKYRLRRYGGIPSYVLHDDLAERHELVLQQALDSVRLDTMMHAFGNIESPDFETTLRMLHFRVSKWFVRAHFVFASRYVQEEVYKRLYKQDQRKLLEFMSQRDQFAAYSVLRGFLFEEHVHSVLPRGGRFEIRRLLPNDEAQAVAKMKAFVGFGGDNDGYWGDEDSEGEEDEDDDGGSADAEAMEVDIPHSGLGAGNDDTSVTLPERRAVAFDGDEELAAADNNVYLRPIARSYKSVDAIVKSGVLFQVTGAHKRPCTQSWLHSVLSHLGDLELPRLYFVLPPVRFDGFQYQTGLDNTVEQAGHTNVRKIEQFALKVELPLE